MLNSDTPLLAYPFPHLPEPGSTLTVAPGIRWLRMRLPFQLDHINLWLIDADSGWCIVDTGFADDATRQSWESVLAGLERPVQRLIVTHFHPDHLGLATWLQAKTGAPLDMSLGEFLTAHAVWNEVGGHGAHFMSEQFRQHGLAGERLAKYQTRGSGYRISVPELPPHYRRLQDGDEIDLGGKVWGLLGGYGHSPEHIALYCRELGVLISGDMLLPRISTNISVMAATPSDDALGRYLASLDRYSRELPAATLVLPAHGLPFVGVQGRVAALQAHHAERLEVLAAACGQPRSAADLLPTLFPRPLDTHQTMFAMGETIAHLNHLEQAGRLCSKRSPDGVIRFVGKGDSSCRNQAKATHSG